MKELSWGSRGPDWVINPQPLGVGSRDVLGGCPGRLPWDTSGQWSWDRNLMGCDPAWDLSLKVVAEVTES